VVDDPQGIFVAPSGDDAESGSKDEPFRTITKAISEAADTGGTIYVCNGTFEEHLVVSADRVVIRGGYACPSATITGWLYEAGTRARVRPSDPGYALHLDAVDGFVASDLDLAARDATAAGASSVGVFASSSTAVRFERLRIVAGDGMDGDDGMIAESNHFTGTPHGNNATLAAGGLAVVCACGDGSMSTGALGGAGGITPTAGGLGLPDYMMGGGAPGAAGTAVTACTNGGLGAPAPTRAQASGAQVVGSINASDGWVPRAGSNGSNGEPGQGGGGGGGAVGAGKGGGGGGACGGCGGSGGPGGMGGGASIGLLALDSEIVFDSLSRIETGDAGSGGAGAAGEVGQDGGTRGIADGNGCPGGTGGKGATGGAGGGGAAGVSVGVLSKGGAITSTGVTFSLGNEGVAGPGGGNDNDGVAGVAQEVLEL
jgi:hypothetical protein